MKRSCFLFLIAASTLFAAGDLSHRRAPGFSIPDAVQQQHDLADYRGKYLVIEFMQTKCVHCVKFAEIIEKLMIKYRGKMNALSIVLPPDTLDTVMAYVKEHNITIPVLFDSGQVAASYLKLGPSTPTVYFPHVFLVDPNGTIVNDWVYQANNLNFFEGDGFIKEIDKLMAGK